MVTTIWTNIQEFMVSIWSAVAMFLYDHPAAIVVLTLVLILGLIHWWTTPSWDPSEDDGHQETP